ncbi:Phage terminase, large subunit GpA [Pseudoxanthobacter soli DSM 19599]|uniref:Phage terminase, large subunit GpA n=1 Tax=Pseudoxanthobacter soli DSM 19599 TaxID=1123029 RepID=A0A1M7ZME5_9HYPH|nr:terminase gpA endonuclease subunit [Pseudoxanthobacter soli]SHO65826.1 Phage terminase, large subunit GpA [Pseudoxanthobacter soli DSM 19599]
MIAQPGGIAVANPDYIHGQAASEVLEPPPPVDYVKWAVNNIEFGENDQFPGPFDLDLFPFFIEPLKALSPDDPCRIVTLAKSAQVGGTILATVFVCGSMAMDPCHFLFTHPTDENGRRWSKMKLAPMLRSTVSLRAIFAAGTKESADALMYKETRDGRGVIQISGANSPAQLSQVTMRRQVQDDLSKWAPNAAGDPEGQADSRSLAHEFAKIFKISTPLVEPGCKITKNLRDGSQEFFHVPCPHCGHRQVLEWGNMLANLDEHHPERAHFTCVACGVEIQEHHRPQMLRRAAKEAHHGYIARNPAARRQHRSFHIWSAYSPLQSWERIARAWLKAKGDPAAEQTFLNDIAGLAFKTSGEAPPWETLRDRAAATGVERGRIPLGGLVVTLGIDCQGDRVEWQAVAWGRERRRWHFDVGVIPGHISEEETRRRLDGLLKQEWTNAAGRKLGVDQVAIDGNAFTEDVWEWVRRHPASRVIMVRGANQEQAPRLVRVKRERDRKGKLLRYSKRFYNFGASILKMSLYRALAKTDPEARSYVGLAKGFDDEYFRQLTAERRVEQTDRTGFKVYRWIKDAAQANEALDTALQAEVAAEKWGVRDLPDAIWDRLEGERETPPAPEQGDIEDMPLFGSQAGLPMGPTAQVPASSGAAEQPGAKADAGSTGSHGARRRGSAGKGLGSIAKRLNS